MDEMEQSIYFAVGDFYGDVADFEWWTDKCSFAGEDDEAIM